MKTTNSKNDLKTKDGRLYVKGTSFEISMASDTMAVADPMNGDQPIKLRAIKLGKYFKGFIKINLGKLYGNEDSHMLDSSVCDSLTGEQVEPDGHDQYGF